MNSNLINTVEATRAKLKEASACLRKFASSEVQHTAAAEPAGKPLDPERVREVFEEMAEANLAKVAEIEPAVINACADPNTLLDALRKLSLRVAASQPDAAKTEAPRRPGQLVNKTATFKENGVQKMKRRCEEFSRQL